MAAGPEGDVFIYEPPDRRLAGHLTLPVIAEGNIAFVDLGIPSSGRFSQDDLRALWDAGAELATWRKARIALPRVTAEFGRPDIAGEAKFVRDWHALITCAEDAATVLAHWPSRLGRRTSWRPVGVPGGAEDLPLTAREVERRGHVLEQEGTLTITKSARWVGHPTPFVSSSVASLAQAVIALVRRSVPVSELSQFRTLLNPIATVAQWASAPTGHRDPDVSSWPVAFVDFAGSCMRAVAELQSAERGHGVVPLLDTDELYEAWLAVTIRDALDSSLGDQIQGDSDVLAAWEHAGIRFELWMKPTFTRAGRIFGEASFSTVVSGVLTPDLLLSASRDKETVLAVFDAKAWTVLLAEDVLAQAGKYLYGIRRVSSPDTVPAVTGVDLVTSAVPPPLVAAELARVNVLESTPTRTPEAVAARLAQVLTVAISGLEEREHLASQF